VRSLLWLLWCCATASWANQAYHKANVSCGEGACRNTVSPFHGSICCADFVLLMFCLAFVELIFWVLFMLLAFCLSPCLVVVWLLVVEVCRRWCTVAADIEGKHL
ncbi:unnamed protein product, partial [Laminaria digitata]